MPNSRPALLVIDMQNDFCRRGAPFEVEGSLALVPRIACLLENWRKARRPVVFTRYVADRSILPLAEKLAWVRALSPPVNACVPGHFRRYDDVAEPVDCTDIIAELAPRAGEAVYAKPFYSAFHGTELMEYLVRENVESVVVAGVVTEMCVADTARHAAHHGLKAAIVSDACGSRSTDAHAATLKDFNSNYGWVVEASETERWIQAGS